MDDIMSMVGQILSDPEQMKQISSLAASLGLSPDHTEKNESAAPLKKDVPPAAPSLSAEDSTFSALLPLIQKLQANSDDKYITFLRALQPLLSDQRKPKVDTAIMFLKLVTFVPYLEESGILPKNNVLNSISQFLKGVLI